MCADDNDRDYMIWSYQKNER